MKKYKLKYKLKKIPKVMRFPLLLRYSSISWHRILLEDFPFPSLLLLEKINRGDTDAVKCRQSLNNGGKLSENSCLFLNELHPQKYEYASNVNYASNMSIFKNFLEYSIIIKRQQKGQHSHNRISNKEAQGTSQWLLPWIFSGWFSH